MITKNMVCEKLKFYLSSRNIYSYLIIMFFIAWFYFNVNFLSELNFKRFDLYEIFYIVLTIIIGIIFILKKMFKDLKWYLLIIIFFLILKTPFLFDFSSVQSENISHLNILFFGPFFIFLFLYLYLVPKKIFTFSIFSYINFLIIAFIILTINPLEIFKEFYLFLLIFVPPLISLIVLLILVEGIPRLIKMLKIRYNKLNN